MNDQQLKNLIDEALNAVEEFTEFDATSAFMGSDMWHNLSPRHQKMVQEAFDEKVLSNRSE